MTEGAEAYQSSWLSVRDLPSVTPDTIRPQSTVSLQVHSICKWRSPWSYSLLHIFQQIYSHTLFWDGFEGLPYLRYCYCLELDKRSEKEKKYPQDYGILEQRSKEDFWIIRYFIWFFLQDGSKENLNIILAQQLRENIIFLTQRNSFLHLWRQIFYQIDSGRCPCRTNQYSDLCEKNGRVDLEPKCNVVDPPVKRRANTIFLKPSREKDWLLSDNTCNQTSKLCNQLDDRKGCRIGTSSGLLG